MKIENINKAVELQKKFRAEKMEEEFLRDNFRVRILVGGEDFHVSDEILKRLRKDLIEENRKKRDELRKQIEEL